MTTEEYTCQACGHQFPSHRPPDEERCPRCGSPKLQRNPWLLGTDEAACLTPEDYRDKVEVTT